MEILVDDYFLKYCSDFTEIFNKNNTHKIIQNGLRDPYNETD